MTGSDNTVSFHLPMGRSALFWLGGTALVVLAIIVWGVVIDLANWPIAVVLLVTFGLIAAWAATKVALDTRNGAFEWRRVLLPDRTVRLADTARLSIDGVGAQVQLVLRGPGRTRRVVLVLLSAHREVSQPAPTLRTLADTIETHTSAKVHGEVVGLLHAQAKHLERGGDARSSPLAARARPGALLAIGGTGATGGGLGQL